MEVCTYQSVACSTTMWGEEEDSLLFIYMRVALGNGRTDASSVVYMYGGLQASYLVPEIGNLPTDIHTYMDLGLAGRKRASERERHTVHMHLRTRRSFQPLIHSQTHLPRLNVASSKLFSRIIILVSYLIFRLEMGQIGGRIRKEIYRYSFG